MDAELLSKKLNGCSYGNEISRELEEKAKENRLVVVFGASDDLLEFRGAICDEIGAWSGEKVYINKHLRFRDDPKNGYKLIEAVWCPLDENGLFYTSWLIKSEIPSFAFDVLEDDELYCKGLVFCIDDI